MSKNDPNDDWMKADKGLPKPDPNEKFERFYYRFKQRVMRGENPDTASSDAPKGFSKWLRSKERLIK